MTGRTSKDVNEKKPSERYPSPIGPFVDRKVGTVLFAPKAVASATCGFTAGAEPPCVGNAWQPTQLSRLKRGPSPSVTCSSSLNEACPLKKSVV